jgi:hypothetical protein
LSWRAGGASNEFIDIRRARALLSAALTRMSQEQLRRSLLSILFVAPLACGGQVLEPPPPTREQPPTGPAGDPGQPSPTSPTPKPSSPGSTPPGLSPEPGETARVPIPSFCDVLLGGTSATDLWCANGLGTNLAHWGGTEWSLIAVPPPTNDGALSRYDVAPAAPGALWVVTSYGLARVHASGPSEDLSATGPHGTSVAVGGSTTFVFDGTTTISSSSAGGGFSPLAPAPSDLDPDFLMAAPDGTLWALGYHGVARLDGAAWTAIGVEAASGFMNSVLAGHALWSAHESYMGAYCPAWCHPGQEPLHEAIVTPVTVHRVDDTSAADALTSIDPPADVPRDGSVQWNGVDVFRTIAGNLGFVGQTLTPAEAAMHANGHFFAYELTGTTLGPGRALAPDVTPSFGNIVALTDGSTVFAAYSVHAWVVVRL